MTPNQLDFILHLLLILAPFVAVLLFINVILRGVAWLGGWSSLAAIYPGRTQTEGETWTFRSMRFGFWAAYNNCVTIGGDSQGLHLSMPWFARAGHEPIFIPWSDIQIAEKQTILGLFPVVSLAFKKCPAVRLRLQASLLGQVQAGARSLRAAAAEHAESNH